MVREGNGKKKPDIRQERRHYQVMVEHVFCHSSSDGVEAAMSTMEGKTKIGNTDGARQGLPTKIYVYRPKNSW